MDFARSHESFELVGETHRGDGGRSLHLDFVLPLILLDHCNILLDSKVGLLLGVCFKVFDSQFLCLPFTAVLIASKDDVSNQFNSFQDIAAENRVKVFFLNCQFLQFFIEFEHQSEFVDFHQHKSVVFIDGSLAERLSILG